MVMHDMLGYKCLTKPCLNFRKNYLQSSGDIRQAVSDYIREVQDGSFPSSEHSFK